MDKRIDYENGVKEITYYDHLTKELHVQRVEDIQPILESNLVLRNDEQASRDGIKRGMLRYGHIPNAVLAQWALEGVNINDTKELFRMINKPENARYKTTTKVHR